VPGVRKGLAVDEPFLVGSLAFVVRSAGLPYLSHRRVITTSPFLAQAGRATEPFGLAKIKVSRSLEPRWLEAILAAAMAPEDLLVAIQSGETAVFRAGASAEAIDRLMHACLAELASWDISATGETACFEPGKPDKPRKARITGQPARRPG